MLKKLKTNLIILLSIIFVSGLICSTLKPKNAYANGFIIPSDIHLKAEASNDNGSSWHNYSGTDNPEGVNVTAKPGDTVKIKIKVWNTNGATDATNVSGTGSVTNSQYIASIPEATIIPDADIDGISYTSYFFAGGSSGAVPQVNHNTSENVGEESLEFSIILSNDFPQGETEILGEVVILGIGGNAIKNTNNSVGKTQGMIYSIFRIVVNAEGNTPRILPPVGMPVWPYLSFFGIILIAILPKFFIGKKLKKS